MIDMRATLMPMRRAASRSCEVARIAWPVSVFVRNQYSIAVIAAVIAKEITRGIEIEMPRKVTLLDE